MIAPLVLVFILLLPRVEHGLSLQLPRRELLLDLLPLFRRAFLLFPARLQLFRLNILLRHQLYPIDLLHHHYIPLLVQH